MPPACRRVSRPIPLHQTVAVLTAAIALGAATAIAQTPQAQAPQAAAPEGLPKGHVRRHPRAIRDQD